jgi:arylsulfatase A-like enzyme
MHYSLIKIPAAIAIGLTGWFMMGCSSFSALESKAVGTKSPSNPKYTSSTNRSPNILLVIADDFGVDASPCYPVGQEKPKMPTLESLCKSGIVFENAWVNPVCTPTRAAILTGKYGFRTNVRGVDDLLSTEETSLQSVLSQAPTPYKSAVIGKWHVAGATPDPDHPQKLGVDFYSGFMSGGVRDYFNWEGIEQGKSFQSTTYTTTHFTNKAIDWVKQQQQPWFLWLAYNAPHAPFHIPPRALHSRTQLSDQRQDIRSNPRPYYFAALEAMDRELGRLLSSLAPETRQNTIVVFIGDNGSPRPVTQTPFTKETVKGTVYEGGVKVPMVIAGARVRRSNERDRSLINGTDLFATFAELAGVKASAVDSKSFVAALSGTSSQSRNFAYTEHLSTKGRGGGLNALGKTDQWAIRDTKYKLIHDGSTNQEFLFNLASDPSEQRNLLATNSTSQESGDAKFEQIARQLRDRANQLKSQPSAK